jgi:putative DNA primase/helicase
MEKPFLRTFETDPVEFVPTHRPEMVMAALMILKAALARGFRHNAGRLASFEVWSDFIRNAVVYVGKRGWLDIADPVKSLEQSCEEDPETQKLSVLLLAA